MKWKQIGPWGGGSDAKSSSLVRLKAFHSEPLWVLRVLFCREISYRVHVVAVYSFDICSQFCGGVYKKCSYLWPQEAYRIGKVTLLVRHSSSSSLLGTRCTRMKKEPYVLPSFILRLSWELCQDLCISVISTTTEVWTRSIGLMAQSEW